MDEREPRLRKAVTARGRMRIERSGGASSASDAIAVEEPLEIRAGGETIAVTMRTPGDDRELAVGFLFAEGLIASAHDVGTLTHCGRIGDPARENTIDVRPAPGFAFDLDKLALSKRGTLRGSACGVCGRASIEDLVADQGVVPAGPALPGSLLARSVAILERSQPSHARTGGLHAAALLDAAGIALYAHEDIGRHNAVDKAIGAWLIASALDSQRTAPRVLVVSGRVSFEIVQKAARAGLYGVCGASAPSSLAIDLAEALGLALAAFVREDGWNLYTHPERVDLDA